MTQSSPVVLYEVLQSVDCIAVLLLAKHSGIDIERVRLNPMVKPLSRSIPSIDVNGTTVSGKDTILRYLATQYCSDFYPSAPDHRHKVDMVLECNQKLDSALKSIIYHETLFAAPQLSETADEMEYFYQQIRRCLSIVENLLESMALELEDSVCFLTGSQPTIADISVICTLLRVNLLEDFDVTTTHPHINEWASSISLYFQEFFFDLSSGFGCLPRNHPLAFKHRYLESRADSRFDARTLWDPVTNRYYFLEQILEEVKEASEWSIFKKHKGIVVRESPSPQESSLPSLVFETVIKLRKDGVNFDVLIDWILTNDMFLANRRLLQRNGESEVASTLFDVPGADKRGRKSKFEVVFAMHPFLLQDDSGCAVALLSTEHVGAFKVEGYPRVEIPLGGWVFKQIPGHPSHYKVSYYLNLEFKSRLSSHAVAYLISQPIRVMEKLSLLVNLVVDESMLSTTQ